MNCKAVAGLGLSLCSTMLGSWRSNIYCQMGLENSYSDTVVSALNSSDQQVRTVQLTTYHNLRKYCLKSKDRRARRGRCELMSKPSAAVRSAINSTQASFFCLVFWEGCLVSASYPASSEPPHIRKRNASCCHFQTGEKTNKTHE